MYRYRQKTHNCEAPSRRKRRPNAQLAARLRAVADEHAVSLDRVTCSSREEPTESKRWKKNKTTPLRVVLACILSSF